MANIDDEDQGLQKDERSASPPGWPNMPGRSEEHENHAGKDGKDAEVTEEQRELEHEFHTPSPSP